MESFDSALAAGRSIVVLNVPWSGYAVRATATLELASSNLESLGITFATADEESPDVRQWLNENARETLGGYDPRGAGSLFWLEHGSVVDLEVAGGNLTLYELLARTRNRWDASRTT